MHVLIHVCVGGGGSLSLVNLSPSGGEQEFLVTNCVLGGIFTVPNSKLYYFCGHT